MIRLAVLGDESEVDSVAHECLSVADRLRGATLSAVANLEQLGGGFDAVVVCGRDGAVQASASAAQRSLHVLLTHLPSSTASANELRELERLNGVRVVTSSVQRFLPATQAIKQSLASGQLGDAGLLRIHRWRAATREAALADDLDTAIWLFDSMPTEVFALQRPTKNEGEYLQVHLGFLAGGMAMIDCCSGLPTANGYFSMSLIGSTGAAYADDHRNQQLLYRGDEPTALKTTADALARLAQLEDFCRAVGDESSPAESSDGCPAAVVFEAARASAASGRAARWTGDRYEL